MVLLVVLLQLTSQHPYAEEFIGEPHVFTVDVHNESELRRALQDALDAHSQNKVCGHTSRVVVLSWFYVHPWSEVFSSYTAERASGWLCHGNNHGSVLPVA